MSSSKQKPEPITQSQDALGRTIEVGDLVLLSANMSSNLSLVEVVGFTPKMIKVRYCYRDREDLPTVSPFTGYRLSIKSLSCYPAQASLVKTHDDRPILAFARDVMFR